MSCTVAIADNHDVTRWGVKSVVENRGDRVVCAAESGPEILSMIDRNGPDVVIMSLNLPLLNGFEVLSRLESRSADVRAVLLTTFDEPDHVRVAFQRGASAYVLKQDPLQELDEALDAVARGACYLSSALPEDLLSECQEADAPDGAHRSLTMREREILLLTAEGFTSREAGTRLDISHRTVEKHRQHIKEKLGLSSTVEMVRYVYQNDLLLSPHVEKPDPVRVS